MKQTIKRFMIAYCAIKALKHENIIELFRKQSVPDFIWATGSHAIYRDKWLGRIKKIQEW